MPQTTPEATAGHLLLSIRETAVFTDKAQIRCTISKTVPMRTKGFESILSLAIPASSCRITGVWRLFSAVIGREAGYMLDGSPLHHRETQGKQPSMHILTPKDNVERTVNLNHVSDLWKEPRIFRKNRQTLTERPYIS